MEKSTQHQARLPIFVGLLISLTACDKIPFLDSSHGAISACEDKIINHLKSPSTYERVEADYAPKDFTFDDYYESEGGDACKPYASGDCDDVKKFLRAYGVKMWLLAKDEIIAGKEYQEIIDRTEKMHFPKVSDKKKWQADHDYLKFVYDRNYGPRKKHDLPAAFASITYDAVNSYNAPVRDKYVCAFKPMDGNTYTSGALY